MVYVHERVVMSRIIGGKESFSTHSSKYAPTTREKGIHRNVRNTIDMLRRQWVIPVRPSFFSVFPPMGLVVSFHPSVWTDGQADVR